MKKEFVRLCIKFSMKEEDVASFVEFVLKAFLARVYLRREAKGSLHAKCEEGQGRVPMCR